MPLEIFIEDVALLELLTRKEYPERSDDFENVSKQAIKRHAVNLMKRLYPEEDPEPEGDNEVQAEPLSLQEAISQSMKSKEKSTMNTDLDKDFKLLEATHEMSSRLEKLRKALLSIPPTSTICEQSFSVADALKNKKRNRMGSKRLNALMWLKRYFQNLAV